MRVFNLCLKFCLGNYCQKWPPKWSWFAVHTSTGVENTETFENKTKKSPPSTLTLQDVSTTQRNYAQTNAEFFKHSKQNTDSCMWVKFRFNANFCLYHSPGVHNGALSCIQVALTTSLKVSQQCQFTLISRVYESASCSILQRSRSALIWHTSCCFWRWARNMRRKITIYTLGKNANVMPGCKRQLQEFGEHCAAGGSGSRQYTSLITKQVQEIPWSHNNVTTKVPFERWDRVFIH